MAASSAAVAVREPRASYRVLDSSQIDARVLRVFADKPLRAEVRRLQKVELASVRALTERALEKHRQPSLRPPEALDVHRRVLEGLPGESLLISASMFLQSMAEAEAFFERSFKTIKSKLGKSLDSATSERVMRAARVTTTAAEVLGSFDAAFEYMHERNFALGGATPAELLRTGDGERIILNELQAQAEGGPL
jgi:uncharacterized protein (DUF2384 family)